MKLLALAMVGIVVLLTVIANLGYANAVFRLVAYVPGGDTTGHFVLYGAVSFAILAWSVRRPWGATGGRQAGVVAALALLVALEELSQARIPVRTFSLVDLAASLSGLVAGALAALQWARPRRSRSSA